MAEIPALSNSESGWLLHHFAQAVDLLEAYAPAAIQNYRIPMWKSLIRDAEVMLAKKRGVFGDKIG